MGNIVRHEDQKGFNDGTPGSSVNKFGGFGFRNYWASACKDVIDEIHRKNITSGSQNMAVNIAG